MNTSLQAYQKVDRVKDRDYIVEFIKANGTGYLKQIAREMGKQKNEISGRFSELKSDKFNLIEPTGQISEGCCVYRLKEWKLF